MILPLLRLAGSVVVLYGSATRDQLQHQHHQRHNENKVNKASESTDEAKCPEYEQNYQKCPKHELFSNLFLFDSVSLPFVSSVGLRLPSLSPSSTQLPCHCVITDSLKHVPQWSITASMMHSYPPYISRDGLARPLFYR
jgi:hypothetical protein